MIVGTYQLSISHQGSNTSTQEDINARSVLQTCITKA